MQNDIIIQINVKRQFAKVIVPFKIPRSENERVDEITTAAADSMSCTYREGEPCHVVYMSISRSFDCYLHFKHCPFFFQKRRVNIWGALKVLFDTLQGCTTEQGKYSQNPLMCLLLQEIPKLVALI